VNRPRWRAIHPEIPRCGIGAFDIAFAFDVGFELVGALLAAPAFDSALAPLHQERNLRKLKILIVDDSAVMRKIVERALRQAGLDLGEVLETSNGAEALVEVQKGSLDIILSDINMPVMDGLEFLKSLPGIEAAKGERPR